MVEEQGREQDDETPEVPAPALKPPRPWGWGFLLHSSTFGLYTIFWMVGLLREIRSLNQPKVRPWLWFFVPLATPAQLFALPRLADYIRNAEVALGLSAWGRSRILCIVGIIAVSLFFNLQEIIATPTWLIVPGMLAWAGFFSVIEARFNRVRQVFAGDPPTKPATRNPYRWWEWLLLIPFAPLSFLVVPYLSLDSLGFYNVETLEEQSTYQDETGRYQFPVVSSGWREVSPGTYSEDEAELELGGPIEDVYAIVYRYEGLTLDELAYDRKTSFYDWLNGGSCEESRRFTGEGLDLAAHVTCEGQEYGMDSLWSSGIIARDGVVYELMVNMNVPGISFRNLRPELVRMTKEFSPL